MNDIKFISKYGYKYICIFGILLILSIIFSTWICFFLIIFLITVFLYRNPERLETLDDPKAVYSPIDGKVSEIDIIKIGDDEFIKVSIMNEIYNIGQVRLPMSSNCEEITYTKGLSLCTHMNLSSHLNQRVIYKLKNEYIDYKMVIIGGALTRKIYYESFQYLRANRRLAFLFDGKVVLYLPKNIRLSIARDITIKACEPIGFVD